MKIIDEITFLMQEKKESCREQSLQLSFQWDLYYASHSRLLCRNYEGGEEV